jgi:hypothetical protein
MKISLKLANGATLEFEGDAADFERVQEFLAEPPDSLTADPPAGSHLTPPDAGGERGGAPNGAPLEPAVVAARLEEVGANNDQERVTVIAQLAIDAGRDGVDYDTLNHLYSELAFKKPAQFPTKTLSNAKSSGLVAMVKPGVWRPTYRGENFAKGHGRGGSAPRRSPSPTGSSTNRGGESD